MENQQKVDSTVEVVGFNIIEKISLVAKCLEGSHLEKQCLDDIKEQLEILSKFLDTTTQQAMLFSIVFVLQSKLYSVDLSSINNFLDINYIDGLIFKNELDILLEKNLLEISDDQPKRKKKSNFGRSSFIIPDDVADQIYANQPIISKVHEALDIYGFASKVSDLIDKRKYQAIDSLNLFFQVDELETKNSHLKQITLLKSKLTSDERTLLYEVLNDLLNYCMPSNLEMTLNNIFDRPRDRRVMYSSLINKANRLFELEFIELTDGRFGNDLGVLLTNRGIKYFLENDSELFLQKQKPKNIISNETIETKELFYDSSLENEVSFLAQSLMNDNFICLQERMTKMNLPKGCTVLMYGVPGSGKTETCFQLAKKTGRDIYKVEIQEVKSMWFGQSEKQIKEIFDNYKRICKKSKIVPILLFNEADGILSRRSDNQLSSVSQTENAIQNLILNELENFDGIAFFNTNLQNNLDSAYERRFLFKIKFDTPSINVKAKIWSSKLPWLEKEFAIQLANSFSLSGGEIDNIVRKIAMKEVLLGVRPDSSEILQFCQCEKLISSNKGNKVGFI